MLIEAASTLAVAISLTTGCLPDHAWITWTPPSSARVLFTSQCGGLTCWERWIDVDGKRLGYSKACDVPHSSMSSGSDITVAP